MTELPNHAHHVQGAYPLDLADADTVVVGSGIAGLLAAVTAAETARPGRVVIVDPHPAGGRARCDDREGFTFNRGPRALYINGPADRALRAVGVVTTQGAKPGLHGALAISGGVAHRFPGTAWSGARTTLLTGREKLVMARAGAALMQARPSSTDGKSVSQWLDERAISGTVRALIEALIRLSTYTHSPDTLAATAAIANTVRGISPGVRYLDGGWQSLVDQLVAIATARGVAFHRAAVRSIVPGEAFATVTITGGETIRARTVIIAAGGPDGAGALLPAAPPSWNHLGPAVTAACLELAIRGEPEHRFALGIDEPLYASTHSPPAKLAPKGHSVVHLMRYQSQDDDVSAQAQHQRLRQLAATIGIAPDQIVNQRFLAKMVVANTAPTVATGGTQGRPGVGLPDYPGVFVAGDWVGPTGLLLDAAASSAVEAGQHGATRSASMVRS